MITLLSANIDDFPVLRRIELEAAALFSPEDLPPHLAQPASDEELSRAASAGLLWLARIEDGTTAGFIACECIDQALHIVEMDVAPALGRRGIGTQMLLHTIAQASGMPGVRALTLTTFRHVPWNAPFYARHGFELLAGDGGFSHLGPLLEAEAARGLRNRVAMTRGVA